MKKVLTFTGDARVLDCILQENRFRIRRGQVTGTLSDAKEAEVADSKEAEVADTKAVENTDAKESEVADSKEAEVADSKKTTKKNK